MKARIFLRNRNEIIKDKPEWIQVMKIHNVSELARLTAQGHQKTQALRDLCRAISAIFDVSVRLQYDNLDIIIDEIEV